MSTPKLQLALDVLDLQQALAATRKAQDSIDVIEVGTLLCLSEGMHAVRAMRAEFPAKTIVGDVRIVRAGRNIAEMTFNAGADWVSVVGEAPLETVAAAVKVAQDYNGEIQLELNHDWTQDQAKAWRDLGIEQVIFHSTSEVEAVGSGWSRKSLDTLQKLCSMGFKVTATGGIKPDSIANFAGIPVFVFIGGRAIAQASNPATAAQTFKQAISTIYG